MQQWIAADGRGQGLGSALHVASPQCFCAVGEARSSEDLIALGTKRGLKNPQDWALNVVASGQTPGHWSQVA